MKIKYINGYECLPYWIPGCWYCLECKQIDNCIDVSRHIFYEANENGVLVTYKVKLNLERVYES